MATSKFLFHMMFALLPIGGMAQTTDEGIRHLQRMDSLKSYANAAVDSLKSLGVTEYMKYKYNSRQLSVVKGVKGECMSTHEMLMNALFGLCYQNRIHARKLKAAYNLANIRIRTNTEIFFDHMIDTYLLTSFSSTNKKLMQLIDSLKDREYISFDPIMEMSHTCYIFWHKGYLAIVFVPNSFTFNQKINDKIVSTTKEVLDHYNE
ncbi:hypothetical protein [Prevotella intermedia]|uniref:Uncharacterized protein n=1 Tax=Prevotella intermedia TaxID=28131 RepID=A0A0S3UJF7_PREIN|nr:hypothetical protein [Prevotella intermedia]BAU17644.1 hypothetical protein PIOMA14_I_1136 [Prevotella intermedia]